MSDKPTFIYALCEPGTEVAAGELPPPSAVRYVGKSVEPQTRYHNHLTHFEGTHRSRWIRKCMLAGSPPVLVLIEMVPAGADWQEAERRWIAHYRALGARLTNGTAGGDGVVDPTGEVAAKRIAAVKVALNTPESKAKLAAISKARWEDPEARAAMLVNRKPQKRSAEEKAKLSAVRKAAWQDPEQRAAMSAGISAAQTRRNASLTLEERKARFASFSTARDLDAHSARWTALLKASWADPEQRAKRLDSIKAAMARPTYKASHSAAMKAEWANDPARKTATSAAMKAAWSDPEKRAARCAAIKAALARRRTAKA